MNVPTNIRFGMEKKARERMEKRIQEAKDRGLYNAQTKHLYVDEKTKVRNQKKVKTAKSGRGLTGSIGKYKNGVLHISKKDIEATSARGPKQGVVSNRAFNGLGGDHRKRGNKQDNKKKKSKR